MVVVIIPGGGDGWKLALVEITEINRGVRHEGFVLLALMRRER